MPAPTCHVRKIQLSKISLPPHKELKRQQSFPQFSSIIDTMASFGVIFVVKYGLNYTSYFSSRHSMEITWVSHVWSLHLSNRCIERCHAPSLTGSILCLSECVFESFFEFPKSLSWPSNCETLIYKRTTIYWDISEEASVFFQRSEAYLKVRSLFILLWGPCTRARVERRG